MTDPISAVLLDDSVNFSLTELCALCRVSEELVVEIVAEGIVDPSGTEPRQWRFSGIALARVRRGRQCGGWLSPISTVNRDGAGGQ
jgi:chaperone modulatory protein CbpM